MQRRRVVPFEQPRQGGQAIGVEVAHRADHDLGAGTHDGRQQRGPGFAQQRSHPSLAQLVQDDRFGLGAGHRLQGRRLVAFETVAGHRPAHGFVAPVPAPFLVFLPQPALERLGAHENAVVQHHARRRVQIAGEFAARHEDLETLPGLLPLQVGEEEMRLAGAAEAARIDQAVGRQTAVGGFHLERIDMGFRQRERLESGGFHRFPQPFALVHPVAHFAFRHVPGEGNVMLPAIQLAHLQEEGAQGQIASVLGIGDVAVFLDGADNGAHVELVHGNPPLNSQVILSDYAPTSIAKEPACATGS
ncbi:MAG: hypothetical protein FD132_1203 [bacterium]|nr:MAG: hypothetical protein FD132_1203 [bacterium]